MQIIIMIVVMMLMLAIVGALYWYFSWNIKKMLEGMGLKIASKIFYSCSYLVLAILLIFRSVFIIAVLYGLMMFAAAAVVRRVLKILKLYDKSHRIMHMIYQNGITVMVIACLLSIYAAYNARNLVVVAYDVKVDKELEAPVRIGFVSDIHMGTAVNSREMNKLYNTFIEENPDLICLGGDIFDESTSSKEMKVCTDVLAKLAKKFPVYYIKGNHDDGAPKDYFDELEESGVKILDDEYIITNGFCLVGRTDEGMGTERAVNKPIADIIDDNARQYPVVVLDHRPTSFDEEKDAGVDVVISGHTHDGQIFPGNLTVGLFNDLGYGRYEDGSFSAVVSAGMGTWYFPVRTGSHSEVNIVTIMQ